MALAKKLVLPQDWKDAEEVIGKGSDRTLLYGPPGTGKTYAGRHCGNPDPKRTYNIYVSEESPAYDVIGRPKIKDGGEEWMDGPALLAWRYGGRLVINEIDKASGDTLDALLAILDDPDSVGYTLPTGEYVKPTRGFHAIATMNGDPDDLPEALKDRFTTRINIEHPHPAAIAALPSDLQQIAKECTNPTLELDRRLNIRQFRAFAELRSKKVSPDVAARATFHHRASDILAAISAASVKKSARAAGLA